MEEIKNESNGNAVDKLNRFLQKSVKSLKVSPLQSPERKEMPSVHFSREIDNFYCDFTLQNSETLIIVLTSQVDATVYELTLTKESKRDHEELNFFQTNEEVYEYLMENMQEKEKEQKESLVSIQQNGRVSIKVISTIGKKQRQRVITLSPSKVQQDKQAYLQNVVKKIGKSVLELRKELEIVKQAQEEMTKVNKELLSKLQQYGAKIPFNIDRKDNHYIKFKQVDRKVIKAIDNTTYFSLFGETPLPKNQNSFFNIKLGSTLSRNVMVGIGSKFIKGISNVYSHQDFIGFYTYEECYIWQKGNQRDLSLKTFPIDQGTIITTNVNLSQGYVSWQLCGVRVAYAVIPLQLKAKLLFPVILMVNVNDWIEIDP